MIAWIQHAGNALALGGTFILLVAVVALLLAGDQRTRDRARRAIELAVLTCLLGYGLMTVVSVSLQTLQSVPAQVQQRR